MKNRDKPWLDWPEERLERETSWVTHFAGRYLQKLIETGELKFGDPFKFWVLEREGFIEPTPAGWQITEHGEHWAREKAWTTHVMDTALLLKANPTYSGDLIPKHRIRKPFRYAGRLWVCTGGYNVSYAHIRALNDAQVACYQVVDPADYHGDPQPRDKDTFYFGKYGYMGVVVCHGRQRYVMTGQRLIIQRGDPAPQQQSLFKAAATC